MKILKVVTCGGCGNSTFKYNLDEMGWCESERRGINRYTLPDWCPLEDDPTSISVVYESTSPDARLILDEE